MRITKLILLLVTCSMLCMSCFQHEKTKNLPSNTLNYFGNIDAPNYRESLVYSDQGAWFGYGFLNKINNENIGFAGPFLMSRNNGYWFSNALTTISVLDNTTNTLLKWSRKREKTNAYNSHLEEYYTSEKATISTKLVYKDQYSAWICFTLYNSSSHQIELTPIISNQLFDSTTTTQGFNNCLRFSDSLGVIGDVTVYAENHDFTLHCLGNEQKYQFEQISLKPNDSIHYFIEHFFPADTLSDDIVDKQTINTISYERLLNDRINEKAAQINRLYQTIDPSFKEKKYHDLISKLILTLQNNWRCAAGGLKYAGLFPSYHYKWFHGFWAWDSWKHAAALALYSPDLAKEQLLAMYSWQDSSGFIPDCIYRNNIIEKNNYRNTKPPLSGWAIKSYFNQTNDTSFLVSIFPQLISQHEWWYHHRDHDFDSICEFGSTDGTLVAAKWESGMDNAVRFDQSTLIQNSNNAYSLAQESVDLNSYLFLEKRIISEFAHLLGYVEIEEMYKQHATTLGAKIKQQFYNDKIGWFFDTSLDGVQQTASMGCEGWTPLWVNVADSLQAEAVISNMLNSNTFYSLVPFQTLSRKEKEFTPYRGYWRGPVWIDQTAFGIEALRNYGYDKEANEALHKLIDNSEGLLNKGPSIRENYNPITGEGMEAENFSWSAAHIIMLLSKPTLN